MRWKDGIIIALISFGLGIIAGYLLHGYPTSESIRNWVIGGLSFAVVVELVGFLREWYKDRKEEKSKQKEKLEQEMAKKREKKEKDKLSHSQKLVDKELKLITGTFIGFSDAHSLKLCNKGRLFNAQTYENYSNEVNTHLEKGYSEVWKHKTDCDSCINNHNTLAEVLLDATKEEILKEIKERNLSLIEWNGEGQPPIKYFVPDYLFVDVGYVIQSSYERIFDIDQYYVINLSDNSSNPTTNGEYLRDQLAIPYPEYCKWKLKFNHVLAEGDKNVMEELKRIIKAALNIALTKDDFSKLKNYKKDAEREHNFFYKEIIEIIKNVDNGIPLNDECKICKNY